MKTNKKIREHALEVYEYILKNPEHHSQKNFFSGPDVATVSCGTTMCVAGTSQFLAYGNFQTARDSNSSGEESALRLGLETEREVNALFYEMNEEAALAKLRKIVLGKSFSKKDLKTTDIA